MNTDVLQAGINLSAIMMDYCAKYTGISDILQEYSEQIMSSIGVFEKEKKHLPKHLHYCLANGNNYRIYPQHQRDIQTDESSFN